MNTVPPNDWSFYEMLNEIVQQEPATSLDAEQMGSVAAIGIVKGKAFCFPTSADEEDHHRGARRRQCSLAHPFHESARSELVLLSRLGLDEFPVRHRLRFETPIPEDHEGGAPSHTRAPAIARWMRRTNFFRTAHRHYASHGHAYDRHWLAISPRLFGREQELLRRREDLQMHTAQRDSGSEFWSFTLYDNMTRSMLDTPQRFPRAGSQSYPSPAAEASADGSTTVYFSPTQPEGVKRGNWIQTDPQKGWFIILRLYSPLEPFFAKEWRPSEIELVE
jgi:hypothetical protein